MKKIFATVLALVMCFLSVNVTAFAAENEIMVEVTELFPLAEGITALPYGAVNSSSLSITVSEDTNDALLFSYTTTAAGDYCFNFTDLHAYVSVCTFEGVEPEWVYRDVDSEYIGENGWEMRDRLIFNLKADTTYYFAVAGYTTSTTKLSIIKTSEVLENTVKSIAPSTFLYNVDSTWAVEDIDNRCFAYTVTFADNSSEEDSSAQIEKVGYVLPEITYAGAVINMHDQQFLAQGRQPMTWVYNGYSGTMYITVKSFAEWLVGAGAPLIAENQHCLIQYVDSELRMGCWRIKMAQSGYFGVWRDNTDDFDTNFNYYSIEIVDKNDCVIAYDESLRAWPLIAGEEYILSFQYQYNEYCTTNDIEFWFQKDPYMPANKWIMVGNRWYKFENGTLVKNAWRKDSKGWVKLGADGAMLTNKWTTDSKGWCYVGADGYAVTNCWKKDSKGWIYLDANGSMTKSKWILDGGKWYYVDAEGYMVSNKWMKDSKGWVYLGADGAMLTNKWCTDSKGWCYVGADGYAVTNCWKKDSKGWIWLDANGSMTKSKWVKDGGKWYYCDASGYMVANKSLTISGKKYNFNASGVCTNP